MPINLIPLKAGMLPLPTFQISLIQVNDDSTRGNPGSIIAHVVFLGARQVSVVPHTSSAHMFVTDDMSNLAISGVGGGGSGFGLSSQWRMI